MVVRMILVTLGFWLRQGEISSGLLAIGTWLAYSLCRTHHFLILSYGPTG